MPTTADQNMTSFFHGLALANYRGIGPDIQCMGPFQAFNFFIGANNSGKSNVLNFIAKHVPKLCDSGKTRLEFDDLEFNVNSPGHRPIVRIAMLKQEIWAHFQSKISTATGQKHIRDYLETILNAVCDENGLAWFELNINDVNNLDFSIKRPGGFAGILNPQQWSQLWQALFYGHSGGDVNTWIPSTNKALLPTKFSFPRAHLIPAIRQVGAAGHDYDDLSGKGLIDALAALQNPSLNDRPKKLKFDRINAFLQSVTDEPTAMIEIPHDRAHILVHMGRKILPLSSLGTGIHEVIMLASFCTLIESDIVCIEEPEIHLHPLLQRKFIQYLQSETTNQYFIATHSASFIDMHGAAVFHVASTKGSTQIKESLSPNDKFTICQNLGYRASDILQTNAIIWVEGPSDRIYMRHWIHAVDSTLIEGIHYSIMFYGGRLLSHLSANDDEIDEFISLRRLNRHVAIVIDSDRPSSHARINDTKKRLINEFDQSGGVAWLTAGREIENYLTSAVLSEALKKTYSESFVGLSKVGKYDHVLPFEKRPTGKQKAIVQEVVDKVKVARAVCSQPADLKVLDLEKKINEIVQMIHSANI